MHVVNCACACSSPALAFVSRQRKGNLARKQDQTANTPLRIMYSRVARIAPFPGKGCRGHLSAANCRLCTVHTHTQERIHLALPVEFQFACNCCKVEKLKKVECAKCVRRESIHRNGIQFALVIGTQFCTRQSIIERGRDRDRVRERERHGEGKKRASAWTWQGLVPSRRRPPASPR